MTQQEFAALSQPKRFNMFLSWVKGRAPEEKFDYFSSTNCCLARFGKTIMPDSFKTANSYGLRMNNEQILVVLNEDQADGLANLPNRATMGEVAEKLGA